MSRTLDPHLIKEFFDWLTGGHRLRFGRQYFDKQDKKVKFSTSHLPLSLKDLSEHFNGRLYDRSGKLGDQEAPSIGVFLALPGDTMRLFCLDADTAAACNFVNNFLCPWLESENIDYFYEDSRVGRCHLWVKIESTIESARIWFMQLCKKLGHNPHDQSMSLELFPIIKKAFIMRLPGGVHMRSGKRHSVTFRGDTSNDPEVIMRWFLMGKPVTQEFINSNTSLEVKPQRDFHTTGVKDFYFHPRNLPLPEGFTYPRTFERAGSNCQALNWVLNSAADGDLLSSGTGLGHLGGLQIFNLAFWHDRHFSRRTKKIIDEGIKFAREFRDYARTKKNDDGKDHNWETSQARLEENELFQKCDSWEKHFGRCEGCPFRNRITSPKQLIYGKPIERTVDTSNKYNCVHPHELRKGLFPIIERDMLKALEGGKQISLGVKGFQGSGKSYWLSHFAVELSRRGYKVGISCRAGALALEHKQRIEEAGSHAHLLRSHRAIFENELEPIECPHFDTINHLITKIGVSSKGIQAQFCKKCPYSNICSYPSQYTELKSDEHRIIIFMHAHLSSPESMRHIDEKKLDVLLIDEDFYESCASMIKPQQSEWMFLSQFPHIQWTSDLAYWLEHGGKPRRSIDPKIWEIEELLAAYSDKLVPWRIPEYLRAFKNEQYLDKAIGLFNFTPVPKIPVRLISSATAPEAILRIVLDDPNMLFYAEKDVADYEILNPRSRVIQILDKTLSKTSFQGTRDGTGDYEYERLVDYLSWTCNRMTEEWINKKVLFTTYKPWKTVCANWVHKNHPKVLDRLTIGHMAVGTNEYEGFDVQVICAGVYHNGKQYAEAVFKLKSIANFWNKANDRPIMDNPYPWGFTDESEIPKEPVSVRRVEKDDKGRAYLFEYPQFKYFRPSDYFYNLIDEHNNSKTQQAIRNMRFMTNDEKLSVVAGNIFLPNFLVKYSYTESQLLAGEANQVLTFSQSVI